MQPVNLYSLLSVRNTFEVDIYKKTADSFGVSLKESELNDLNELVKCFFEEKYYNLEYFYVDFKIPQINCEFDLLRISNESIINIELKSTLKIEKARKQLLEHKFYLNFLEVPTYCFTFVADENQFYFIDAEDNFVLISIDTVIESLREQINFEKKDLVELFSPKNFLVSPFNSHKKFIDKKYILTERQTEIKNKIIDKYEKKTEHVFISITGGPGTGKTLLTYDIASTIIDNGKKVLIIHCGDLNRGQRRLNRVPNWDIKGISEFDSFISDIKDYDVIIFDECQRNKRYQFDLLIEKIKENKKLYIFSYDRKQCFSDAEFKRNIPSVIENELHAEVFTLTNSIRINQELSSFINNLFDKTKYNQNMMYPNVELIYFNNIELAKSHIKFLINQDWEVFNYTGSFFDKLVYEKYQFSFNENAHKIIGQEFDNIVGVIDQTFFYNQHSLLETRPIPKSPGYNLDKMLYQILTRARLKIKLVIIGNIDIYKYCLKILNKK
ncbi:hypothetical protein GY31_13105 [Lysinibacillus sphaericus]|uniref:DNA/RNA helicase domain-containing protein n=1 Tax=Lysinibacillus TaxID=400634 RepID=UPI00084B0828|nr:DNA/RNA helicase domain-containing protein [Lysinibacillus sphaericus]OEC01244.1 hypothetical protein GY31_13105 [Lysinibacillus sphaericus]